MSWDALPLLTDSDLGQVEPSATAPAKRWGQVTWPAQRDQARRELAVWLEADFGVGAADRLLDRWSPSVAYAYTGGDTEDITALVSDTTDDGVDLAVRFATPATDALYLGLDSTFTGLQMQMRGARNAAPATLTVAYWGPDGWTPLTIQDGTATDAGITLARSGRVTWDLPGDWERYRLAGASRAFFVVRLQVSAMLTTGATATQILPTRVSEGLRQVGVQLALAIITRGLAAKAADPREWTLRADAYQERAVELYGRLKASGGVLVDEDGDDVIRPSERAVPRPVRVLRG